MGDLRANFPRFRHVFELSTSKTGWTRQLHEIDGWRSFVKLLFSITLRGQPEIETVNMRSSARRLANVTRFLETGAPTGLTGYIWNTLTSSLQIADSLTA